MAACDPVADVQDAPVYPAPVATAVLQGTITGLGTRRPVGLQYNGEHVCVDPAQAGNPAAPRIECRFLGVLGQATTAFSFGSLPARTPYAITVSTHPFGKHCTVTNGSGIIGEPAPPPSVACVNDPAVARHAVSGSIAPAASQTPGLKVMLTTEESVRTLAASGLESFRFDDAVFDSGSNLPVFAWRVTATIDSAGGTVDNCNVTGGPVAGTGSNIEPDGSASVAPAAGITGISVTACTFDVALRAEAAAGGPSAMGFGGLTVALRHQRTGTDVQSVTLPSFGAGGVAAFTGLRSNVDAIYELVVKRQPDGQVCIPGFSGAVAGSTPTDAGAVLLLRPAGNASVPGNWLINRALRCRALPAEGARLTGVYQQFMPVPGEAPQPTRNFIAFFADGTYLSGAHSASSVTSGVEHGFYTWSGAAQTLSLLPYTDTSGSGGLSVGGAPVPLWTNVSRSPGPDSRITFTQGGSAGLLVEVPSIGAQMTGAWATADRRRVWIYDGSTYNGFHAGVNGMANAQDACFAIEDPLALGGWFTRRGNASTCALASGTATIFTLDVPNGATTPALPAGFTGKWPQSGSNADGRPSAPVSYSIVPGNPDVLTVQNLRHDGSPVDPPIVMQRQRAH